MNEVFFVYLSDRCKDRRISFADLLKKQDVPKVENSPGKPIRIENRYSSFRGISLGQSIKDAVTESSGRFTIKKVDHPYYKDVNFMQFDQYLIEIDSEKCATLVVDKGFIGALRFSPCFFNLANSTANEIYTAIANKYGFKNGIKKSETRPSIINHEYFLYEEYRGQINTGETVVIDNFSITVFATNRPVFD